MKTAIGIICFCVLWVVTFIPAWIFLIKLAVALIAPKKRWLHILVLFVIYGVIIALPYIFLLIVIGDASQLLVTIVTGLLLLAVVTAFSQALGIKKIQSNLWKYYGYFYDSLLNFYPYKELIHLVGDRAGKYIHEGSRVADIGAGTGNVSAYIMERAPQIDLTVVEPVLSMFKRAQTKVSSKKSKVEFLQQDALQYLSNIEPNSLDVVVISNVLYIIDNRDEFWRLLIRNLSAEGVAIITNSDREGSATLIRYHKKHDKTRLLFHPGLIMVGFIDNLISQLAAGEAFAFVPRNELEQEVKQHGGIAMDFLRCYGGQDDGVNLLFTVTKVKKV